ncbi:hypothetical protein DXN05_09905 [Deminuibacter soli]|uniref:DUF4476 domain-containing protein n=2 Tax=Deminuibacter soli TaxID=2291815 RepID=A0A3E1NMC2_9BACT|nr:hypothetical protein DXN05_09905 [Deminuibacter soli]
MLIIFSSCTGKAKFDKTMWQTKDDMEYPYRNKMLNDLIKNYKLAGIRYTDLINLLGKPQFKDSSSIAYEVITRYDAIDPNYTKRLDFTFSGDSIITSFKIAEWKK